MAQTPAVDQIMILQGDRTIFKDMVYEKLFDSGWRDQVRKLCQDTIKEKGNIGADQLVKEVSTKAREMVPAAVKQDMLMKIRNSLVSQARLYESKT